jgi:hypothetical protein
MKTGAEYFYELYRSQYGRESVCNHREIEEILQRTDDQNAILDAMLRRIGTPSPLPGEERKGL